MRQLGWTRWLCLFVIVVFTGSGCSDRDPGLMGPENGTPVYRLQGIPAGYYDTADPSTGAALRTSLHAVIDDHTRFPYTSTATDTWDILEQADEDPNDPTRILDIYRNASYAKEGGGNSFYNREHPWPNSYGFPNDNSSNYPYTDTHALFLCDDGYNSSRSNKPYRTCTASCGEKPTEFNNGVGGFGGGYPGDSNWTSGSLTAGTWETWSERRGDVARALLYLDVRYEGGTHGVTGANEPDLILTDNESLIASSNTGSNELVGYMGMLTILLQWHVEDPVTDQERARNDVVYSHQGNRNPFVDHPEWVDCVFLGTCGGGDVTPPAAPTGLVATAGDGTVSLDWADNGEGDLDGYHVYRSTTSGGSYSQINGALLTASAYTDNVVTNGTTYYYVVTAVDLSANESVFSGESSATPMGSGGPPAVVWINEFHYDNKKSDSNEFVEVAGADGTNLTGWTLLGYNGSDGSVYKTINLSGTLSDQQGGFGTLAFAFTGLQNGAPDGIALVDDGGVVVEFLSYEGPLTATDGPALGMTAVDVGVSESSRTSANHSLQRTGTGSQGSDFVWQDPQSATEGQPNTGQTFGTGGGDTTPPAPPTGLVATAGDGTVSLDWADNGEGDLDGYHVHRATTSGGSYTQINGALLAGSAYTDNAVTNGTTYYYVVTAVDLAANQSSNSAEASATPQAGGGGGAMHVEAIVLQAVSAGGRNERARATVTVIDAFGAPVSGVSVTGTFTGDIGETVSAETDGSGMAVLTTSGKKKGPISFGFCVDSAVLSGWTYDAAANVLTCDGFGSS